MATIKFIQAQKFSLAGSGASIGDTTITLQSFTQIGGTLLTTTDLGVKAYGTLEPGNGTQEEQISFTGVTQNSNGTATLTGVSTVGFVSPYTEASGLAKTHAGATTFILSNDAGFYGQILTYIDTAIASGGVPSTPSVNGITRISVTAASAATPIAVGDNDPRMLTQAEKNYVASVRTTGIPYVVATGTASALTGTLASSISTLASGTALNVLIPLTVASGVTLNVNALGAKTLKKNATATLASGDLVAGQEASLVFDGTNYQVLNPVIPTAYTLFNAGTTSRDISLTTTLNIPHGLGTTPRIVKVRMIISQNSSAWSYAEGIYYNGTSYTMTVAGSNAATIDGTNGSEFSIYQAISGPTKNVAAFSAPDATNIILTWGKNGTPTGTATLMWEAWA